MVATLEERETTALLFGWLIKDVSDTPAGKPLNSDARALMMQWLAVSIRWASLKIQSAAMVGPPDL